MQVSFKNSFTNLITSAHRVTLRREKYNLSHFSRVVRLSQSNKPSRMHYPLLLLHDATPICALNAADEMHLERAREVKSTYIGRSPAGEASQVARLECVFISTDYSYQAYIRAYCNSKRGEKIKRTRWKDPLFIDAIGLAHQLPSHGRFPSR